MICPRCADKGLILVNYESGEPFDVAICDCWSAGFFRFGDVTARVRAWLGCLSDVHRVSDLRSFGDETDPELISIADQNESEMESDFTQAGKVLVLKPRL